MKRMAGVFLVLAMLVSANALASDDPRVDAKAAFERKDYAEAAKLIEPLASQGDAAAQFNLGVLYINGQGVERNAATAASWFDKAARQGNALAQLNLGILFREGMGVEKDLPRAYMWLDMAVPGLHGDDNQQAVRHRRELSKEMTAEQMQEALDMIDNCQQVGVKNCD
ncbi:MAG: sel1 repeat family protein [Parvibaculum sp.]|uniref:tetratricopeptide repeat protein n=1 Tax=Parvibaculum sp. TaxID=2024848 RepID=UPI0025E8C23B|nr:tetratricopeptide repeat protein [Parvibaculum sp.]MCE9648842.1 sel1 repeat family protein [Parvibaculum sp.]